MFDTTDYPATIAWRDAPESAQGEYENGFLLPQLMVALAVESAGVDWRSEPRRAGLWRRLERYLHQSFPAGGRRAASTRSSATDDGRARLDPPGFQSA